MLTHRRLTQKNRRFVRKEVGSNRAIVTAPHHPSNKSSCSSGLDLKWSGDRSSRLRNRFWPFRPAFLPSSVIVDESDGRRGSGSCFDGECLSSALRSSGEFGSYFLAGCVLDTSQSQTMCSTDSAAVRDANRRSFFGGRFVSS
ncbi:unnamed protein product [Soboliphyme baturini]|uniref:Uncharacterized protein n=1 Tax=Soboliphyme baturini TaxID=241478 RepID=A0A183ILA8_9BILA|nr:unnamed protein product [Soboliphyme baturini]